MLTLALAPFALAFQAADQAPQFELQLVRADAGPVAGAQVRWFEGEAPRDDLGAFEAAALASGKLALADERGRVVIQGARERVNIAASLPGWWGFAFAGEVSPRLALHKDGDLVVYLRDAEGQPVAGVSVEVAFTSRASFSQLLRSASSDSTGRIVVPHLRAWTATNVEAVSRFEWDHAPNLRGDAYEGLALELRVQALPATSTPERVLALPLVDEVVTIEGLRFAAVALEVRVGRDVAPFERYSFEELSTKRQLVGEGRWVDGVYTTELNVWPVRLGHGLSLGLRRNAVSDLLTAAVTADDIADDLRARADVGWLARTWRLRLTRDDAPAVNDEFDVLLPERQSAQRKAVAVTDANGELWIDVRSRFDRHGTLVFSERSGPVRGSVGVVRIDEETPALAKVELVPRSEIPIEIVDDIGAPVAGAKVCWSAWQDSLSTDSFHSFETSLNANQLGQCSLSRPIEHYATGAAWEGRMQVTAHGHAIAEQTFYWHTTRLRFVLERCAVMRGYIRTSDPEAATNLNLLLLRREHDVPESHASGVTLGCSCDGRFEFPDLRPAEYTLIVRRVVSGARPVEITRRNKLVLMPGEVLDLGEIVID
ncbi:MAG: hypothetical protein JNN27_12450 [Planctomycetes bacterium]|nr:hypothetical protein [Planctomycetota bacterium]